MQRVSKENSALIFVFEFISNNIAEYIFRIDKAMQEEYNISGILCQNYERTPEGSGYRPAEQAVRIDGEGLKEVHGC